MTITSGIAWTTMNVRKSDGSTIVDVRPDCTNLDWSTPLAVQDITTIQQSAHARLPLLMDFQLNLAVLFNPTGAHLVFRDLAAGTTTRSTAIVVGGATLNNNCIITDYPPNRGNDGALTIKVPLALVDGALPTWS
jgi:hypothetical protein